MSETAIAMHGEAQRAAAQPETTCDACTKPFARRKRWQRFCSPKCRNDWHGWTKTVREARELVRLALDGCDPAVWNPRARKLLGIK
jgi:hypothetical protein